MIYERFAFEKPEPERQDAVISIKLDPEAADQLAVFLGNIGGDHHTTLRGFFDLMARQLDSQGYTFGNGASKGYLMGKLARLTSNTVVFQKQ